MRICNLILLASAAWFANQAYAEPAGVMHCFTFTRVPSATDADWIAFQNATSGLPKKIPGLKRVSLGKLRRPMGQFRLSAPPGPDETKELLAGRDITMKIRNVNHDYGICMEFESEAAFDAYGHAAAHEAWQSAYFKVREPAPTTFQILLP
ncbi:MAG: hypothetical protein ABI823_05410 [Bryobacteraceae bacterium]